MLVAWLDEHFSGKEDNSRRVWTVYVFLVWYDIYFDENSNKVEKPVNHLDELKAIAEARRDKQLDAPGEVIMAAAESVNDEYDAPNFNSEKDEKTPDDGDEPAIVENDDEPAPVEQEQEGYVNISNPQDDEIYEAPKKPKTPQEQVQMAIESIEKRSKYLDEPNVISDEAVDEALSSISFFEDEDK